MFKTKLILSVLAVLAVLTCTANTNVKKRIKMSYIKNVTYNGQTFLNMQQMRQIDQYICIINKHTDKASLIDNTSKLDQYKDKFNTDTIVVAHSIGNPFFLKYLYNNNLKSNLYVSVAGFCDLFKVEGREDLNSAFVNFSVTDNEINYLKKSVPYRFSLYSDNDHVIPFNILESFISKIDSTPVFIKGVGHMGNRDNISRLTQIEEIINQLY